MFCTKIKLSVDLTVIESYNRFDLIRHCHNGQYEEKMTQSQTTESLCTTRKRILLVNDSKKTIKVKQPALSSSAR